jgi:hypothetical protein
LSTEQLILLVWAWRPDAEFIVLNDVSLFASLQRPERFNAAMLTFVGKVPPYVNIAMVFILPLLENRSFSLNLENLRFRVGPGSLLILNLVRDGIEPLTPAFQGWL